MKLAAIRHARNVRSTTCIDDLRGLTGNERLLKIWDKRDQLRSDFTAWSERKKTIAERFLRWEHLNRLLDHSGGLPLAPQIRQQADAIRDNRSLINEPDPVRPLIEDLSSKLRERLLSLHDALEVERRARVAELVDMPEWREISNDAKDSVLLNVELLPLERPDVGNDAKLLDALRATPISTLDASLDAIPKRMERARAEILALRSENKVVQVKLPRQIDQDAS